VRTLVPELELVYAAGNYIGETPVWSEAEQALYWINCENPPALHWLRPQTGEYRSWPMPQRIGGMVLKQSGGVLVALADGLYDFDIATTNLVLRMASPMPANVALHETQCDREGRLWVGGIDLNATNPDALPRGASLFRLDDGGLTPLVSGITCSNGLAFSVDGRTLYHTDTPTGTVMQWDLDQATGNISRPRKFFQLARTGAWVDGATVDAEGGYWASLVFGGSLQRYSADGALDLEVPLPFSNPTKLAFGGPDFDTIYITTTRLELFGPNSGSEILGNIYAFKPGIKGLADTLLR
jgi:L-arabinonolactonase